MAIKKIFVLLASCSIFSGCSSVGSNWDIQPVNMSSSDDPGSLYQIGRYYQGQNRLDKAAQAYRQALAIDPGFVAARNALGVILSRQGEYKQANEAFEAAAKRSPHASYIQNNLGYAYYLQGNYGKSMSALKQAANLDPHDKTIRNNLELASAKAGKPAETKMALAPREKPMSRVSSGPVVYPSRQEEASAIQAPSRESAAKPEIAESPVAIPVREPGYYRIEVSNGNGVNGFARLVGRELRSQGYPVGRYTNDKPFREKTSHVEYRTGYLKRAEDLGSMLPVKPLITKSKSLRRDISVRLVLGRDMDGRHVVGSMGRMQARSGSFPKPHDRQQL